MRLESVELREQGENVRLAGSFVWRGERHELYFDFPAACRAFVSPSADAFAAVLLPAAMRAGEPLEVVPPVSERLAFQLGRIRDVFNCWYPAELAQIDLVVTPRPAAPPRRPLRSAAFFSGGVDSFYTLLKYRRGAAPLPAPLTHIVFMRGIAFTLESGGQVEQGVASARAVAARLGLELVAGSTNLRSLFPEPFLMWERHFFGSALAGTALALGGGFDCVCIPSSFTYRHLVPHGSTPLVDEWHSTEYTRVLHDGCEATRARKVAKIVEWDRALVTQRLRVCFWSNDGNLNCGLCRKCVRTAVALDIVGALHDTASFARKDRRHWAGRLKNDHLVLIQENLDQALEVGADLEIVSILRRAARRHLVEQRVLKLVARTPIERLVPRARALYQSAHRLAR
jgi:hypothetical protein